ncbi:MAG TPA: hypothetical protein VFC86_04965 [Planctomycetota bacterium]|nr:hypothetical protein [Planctomycetota bacterium]
MNPLAVAALKSFQDGRGSEVKLSVFGGNDPPQGGNRGRAQRQQACVRPLANLDPFVAKVSNEAVEVGRRILAQ